MINVFTSIAGMSTAITTTTSCNYYIPMLHWKEGSGIYGVGLLAFTHASNAENGMPWTDNVKAAYRGRYWGITFGVGY